MSSSPDSAPWTSTSGRRHSSATSSLLALAGIWNTNALGAETHAVLPYSEYLARLPAYLQQLEMESNGKHVTLAGAPVDYDTGPIVWGEPGTNGQHAFYQLIHQGTRIVPCDLIGFLHPGEDLSSPPRPAAREPRRAGRGARVREDGRRGARRGRAGGGRAAPRARGQPAVERAGRRTAHAAFGALIACEHKVFVQGAIWDIDSFDQWGVELGKVLATRITAEIQANDEPELTHDSSTNALVRRVRAARAGRGGGPSA